MFRRSMRRGSMHRGSMLGRSIPQRSLLQRLALSPIVFLLGLVALPALAASGSLIKNEVLKSGPSVSAANVASLNKGSAVEILARQGGWTQIRAGGRTGWVRILSVRTSSAGAGVGDLAAITAQRDRQVVAVAGLRGLTEDDLKGAKFNANEMLWLDRYQANQAEAVRFARAGNLVSKRVEYLPKPKAASTPSSSNSSSAGSGWGFGE
jgi:hypothetical protein